MAIKLNRVAVEIDGKNYEFYKAGFGFQRRLIALQEETSAIINGLSKKYDVPVSKLNTSNKVPDKDKIRLAKKSLEAQEVVSQLFANPKEAVILDRFDQDSMFELIQALS